MYLSSIVRNIPILLLAMIANQTFVSKVMPLRGKCVISVHSNSRYGLSWNPHKPGHLVTASDDTTIRHWYCNKSTLSLIVGTSAAFKRQVRKSLPQQFTQPM